MKYIIILCLFSSILCAPAPSNDFSSIMQNFFSSLSNFKWPDFSSLIPNFGGSSSVTLNVIEINNSSAKLNCTWSGSGSGNLTWSVDGVDQDESSNVLSLVWEDLKKLPGDVVVVSCAGASSGTTSNNVTSAWTTSVSEVMTSVVVPGADVEDDDDSDDDGEMDFSSLIPNFGGSSSVTPNVIEINNSSAKLNCTWSGSGSGNLTWSVDDVDQQESSNVLSLVWEDLKKLPGDEVVVRCSELLGTWEGGWTTWGSEVLGMRQHSGRMICKDTGYDLSCCTGS